MDRGRGRELSSTSSIKLLFYIITSVAFRSVYRKCIVAYFCDWDSKEIFLFNFKICLFCRRFLLAYASFAAFLSAKKWLFVWFSWASTGISCVLVGDTLSLHCYWCDTSIVPTYVFLLRREHSFIEFLMWVRALIASRSRWCGSGMWRHFPRVDGTSRWVYLQEIIVFLLFFAFQVANCDLNYVIMLLFSTKSVPEVALLLNWKSHRESHFR